MNRASLILLGGRWVENHAHCCDYVSYELSPYCVVEYAPVRCVWHGEKETNHQRSSDSYTEIIEKPLQLVPVSAEVIQSSFHMPREEEIPNWR